MSTDAHDTFILARDRDAYATIRGYVYQVDLTISRWLELNENEELHLERGEDIDLVGRAIAAGSEEEAARLLEQVKHREQNVTLRNPASLEALANAVEHLGANPTAHLRFRFTTNASVGKERPCPFPESVPGIVLWEGIRTGTSTGPNRAAAVAALSSFLSQTTCPEGIHDDVWSVFQGVVSHSDTTQLEDLISRFEWSTSQVEADATSDNIRSRLLDLQLASDGEHAQQLYERLFLVVFKKLSEQGAKRLTRSELADQLMAPTLSESDRHTLDRLQQCFRVLEARLSKVENDITAFSENIRQVAETQGVHAELLTTTQSIDISMPPLTARASLRTESVGVLLELHDRTTWLAIRGASDTGKSQLVRLLMDRVAQFAGWIRFSNNMQPGVAAAALVRAMKSLDGHEDSAPGEWSYELSCSSLAAGCTVVLDDLPRLDSDDHLAHQLQLLVTACSKHGIHIVSTSHHAIPYRLSAAMQGAEFEELAVPTLEESETREVLAAHESPESVMSDGLVRLITSLTSGNPLLVSLAAEFLRERQWRFSEQELHGLLKGQHSEKIEDEVVHRIATRLVPQQRDLLYRLTLVPGAFTVETATVLAATPPEIASPREVLDALLGAWVQRDADRRFVISPLIRTVGPASLGNATQKACHLSLGELAVRQRMDVFDAEQAILHFVSAGAVDRAGVLFMLILDLARAHEETIDFCLFPTIWSTLPLPEQMNPGLQLVIRSLQCAVLPKYGTPTDYVIEDLERMIQDSDSQDGWAIATAACFTSIYLATSHYDLVLRLVSLAISSGDIQRPDGALLRLPEDKGFESLFWILIPHTNTNERLEEWLLRVSELDPARRNALFSGADAALGCVVLADRLQVTEAAKPVEEQNWATVLKDLDSLADRARDLGIGVLEAAAVRTCLTIRGEYLHNIDDGVESARDTMGRLQRDDVSTFLIAGMLGRQFAFADRTREAFEMLEIAIGLNVEGFPHECMLNFLFASVCISNVDAEQALTLAENGLRLGLSDESIPAIDVVRAAAEVASAVFLRDPTPSGAVSAFSAWSETAVRMFDCRDDSDAWKETCVLVCHQTSYLNSMALRGRPPKFETGEEFSAPVRGEFLRTNTARLLHYRPNALTSVMWMLSQYASAAENDDAAKRWLTRAVAAQQTDRLSVVDGMIGRDMIPHLAIAGRFGDMLETALRCSHALFRLQHAGDGDVFEEGVDPDRSWADLSPEQRDGIERVASSLAVIPAAFHICFLLLNDREQGVRSCREFASVCRQVATSSVSQELWQSISEVLDELSREGASATSLIAMGNVHSAKSLEAATVLAYLGASVLGTPDQAFNAQIAVVEVALRQIPQQTTGYRLVVVPFFERIWTEILAHRRFSLRNPKSVARSLGEALAAPAERRVKAILNAVREGVRANGSLNLAWLTEVDSKDAKDRSQP